MKTITYDQLETLKRELSSIREELRGDFSLRKDTLEKYKAKELEIKQANRSYNLNAFNREQKSKRETAAIVFGLEVINFDDVTNDGYINKNKVKKYPKYLELEYCRFVRDFQRNTYEVSYKGTWRLYKYVDGNQVRIETFEDFLDYNNVQGKEITLKQFEAMERKLSKAREKAEIALKELAEVNREHYSFNGNLFSQRDNNYYTLKSKF